jgi:CheY-like chemotaxis protein
MIKQTFEREYMPFGKVLAVDDMPSNLDVVKLLLKLYGIEPETAEDGFGAIEKIKAGGVYDIVFMDHMMPGMDGIETTKKIRELGYTQPIVALTANEEDGQSEIFMANGFDAFISKPIDVRQLDSMLKEFVKGRQSPGDTEAMNRQADKSAEGDLGEKGSWLDLYPQLAETFIRDLTTSTGVLQGLYEKRGSYGDEDIRMYTINVHAMKNVLANMGEKDLSKVAAALEQAGREKDTALITAMTPAFLAKLKKITEKLVSRQKDKDAEEGSGIQADGEAELLNSAGYLREKVLVIKKACEVYDRKTAKDTITELKQKKWPQEIRELLGTMTECLLSGDFEELAKISEQITDNK